MISFVALKFIAAILLSDGIHCGVNAACTTLHYGHDVFVSACVYNAGDIDKHFLPDHFKVDGYTIVYDNNFNTCKVS